MESFLLVFLILICIHFLLDYPLQGDFLAKYKARHVDGKYNKIWGHCLTAHAAIHSLPYLVMLGNIPAALTMFITHWLIDLAKCENKISHHTDQLLHILVIFILCAYNTFDIPWLH